jgi:hypothetical protein
VWQPITPAPVTRIRMLSSATPFDSDFRLHSAGGLHFFQH